MSLHYIDYIPDHSRQSQENALFGIFAYIPQALYFQSKVGKSPQLNEY